MVLTLLDVISDSCEDSRVWEVDDLEHLFCVLVVPYRLCVLSHIVANVSTVYKNVSADECIPRRENWKSKQEIYLKNELVCIYLCM